MPPSPSPASTPCPPRGIPNVLSIAGTDPTGGAGIQADLKTFGALDAYGMAVVTAVVAQNTQAVTRVSPLAPELVQAQLEAVFEDVAVAAVKIGMVADAEIAEAIATVLARYRPPFVVFDPVMAASTDKRLMNENDLDRIRTVLLPQVSLLTPNLREAARLLGIAQPVDEAGMRACLPALRALGAENVLLKGGHLTDHAPGHPAREGAHATPHATPEGAGPSGAAGAADRAQTPHAMKVEAPDAIDLLATPAGIIRVAAPRLATRHGHGTGCTLSSAIAALWPRHGLEQATRLAKDYVRGALLHADALQVGHGRGPLHHFWQAVHLPGQLAYHAD